MSAVGVPEERTGVVATAEVAAAAAAEALSLLSAWWPAKEQLAMVMHGGFKVSGEEGGLEKGGLSGGEEAVSPCLPAPDPSRLGPRPRPLHWAQGSGQNNT